MGSIHERAKGVGGKMVVWSEVGSGTEIELSIPASVAYAKSSVTRQSTFLRKGAGDPARLLKVGRDFD